MVIESGMVAELFKGEGERWHTGMREGERKERGRGGVRVRGPYIVDPFSTSMLRRENRPCCFGCSPDPKGLLSPNHFGPRWLRVRSGFDDGGEEQRMAERESRLAELDVVGKDRVRTRCRWVLKGEAAHPGLV